MKGQTLTIMTLIIGIIFIFVVLTLNMKKAAVKRTIMANAADSSVLLLASQLSSYGNKMAEEYLDGREKKCDWNLLLLSSVILIALGVLLSFFTGGASLLAVLATITAQGFFASAALFSFMSLVELNQFDQIDKYYKQMAAEQSMPESAIKNAAFAVIDDRALVTDTNDDDGDGLTNDTIGRFTKFYYERLRNIISSSSYSDAVHDFNDRLATFSGTCNPADFGTGFLRVVRICTPHVEIQDAVLPAFDSSGNLRMNGTSPMSFADWIDGALIPLMDKLIALGPPYNNIPTTMYFNPALPPPMIPGPNPYVSADDEVDLMSNEIDAFERWALSILKEDYSSLNVSFNQWYQEIADSYRDDFNIWIANATSWRDTLQLIENDIQICVSACGAYDWESSSVTALCQSIGTPATWHWVWDTWTDVPDGCTQICDVWRDCDGWNATDPNICDIPDAQPGVYEGFDKCDLNDPTICSGADIPTDTPGFDGNDTGLTGHNVTDTWKGCCGPWKTNCALCTSATCPPGACCGTCCTLLNILGDPLSSQVREAISTLNQFIAHLQSFNDYLDNDFFPAADSITTDLGQYRNIDYYWEDARGKHQVRIKLDIVHPDPFRMPYIKHWREAIGFRNCAGLENHRGLLHMTISRWDDEPQTAGWPAMFSNFLDWNLTTTVDAWAHYGIKKEEVGLGEKAVECIDAACSGLQEHTF